MIEFGDFLSLAVLIVLFWWFWFFPYQTYRLYVYRQRLFRLRDNLFDAFSERQLPHDTAAYTMLRSTINGSILLAEEVCFYRLIQAIKTQAKFKPDYSDRFNAALQEVSPDVRDLLITTRNRLHGELVHHLVHSSLIAYTIFMPISLIFGSILRVKCWILRRQVWDELDEQALVEREFIEKDRGLLTAH